MGAVKFSLLYKLHIFQCMGNLFIVVMESIHWKLYVKIPYPYIVWHNLYSRAPMAPMGIAVCQCVRPSVGPSVCPSVRPSVCLSVYLSVCMSTCLSACLYVCLSVPPSIRLSNCLSVCVRPERRSRFTSLRISAISHGSDDFLNWPCSGQFCVFYGYFNDVTALTL